MVYQPQIVIIGAGIVGLSAAYALLERGMLHVRVLEQATVSHTRATSSGVSRLMRFEYGADAFYSHMAKVSLACWRALEKRLRCKLYTPTGMLNLGNQDDGSMQAYEIACELGLASERLSVTSCQQRFPQFETANYDILTYNPEGGILHASTCLHALKRAILTMGGEIVETSQVTQIIHEQLQRPIRLRLAGGEEINADRVVIAAGPWVHRLLGEFHLPVELTRQYLLYFSGLLTTDFRVGAFPAFLARNLYGMPIHKGSHCWLKASSHDFGRRIADPDAPIQFEDDVIAQIVNELRTLLPALRRAKLAHIEGCTYDVSPDEDFILDYVPGDPRLTFATGLSGHGFKFGPLLGRILSNLICETPSEVSLERFRLARFSSQPQKKVISVA